MAVIRELNNHSRIAAFSCIVTIVDELKKLMGELRKVILWSDGCSSQFRSKFVFALLTHFDRNIASQWNYNEAHIKRDYNLENVCFLELFYLSDDKEPCRTQYYP